MEISFKTHVTRVLNFFLPPRCYACGEVLEATAQLCHQCWGVLNFISTPLCACCGYPFSYEVSEEALCGGCIHKKPPYDRARSVMAYDDGSKPLILRYKHGDALHGAQLLTAWLDRVGQEMYSDLQDPLVIPIPLHWTRLLKRMYNQSAILAQRLSKIRGFTYAPNLLIRKKKTPYLGGLGRAERKKVLAGAFGLGKKAEMLQKRDVLLIDDVHTSGATLNAAAKALKKGGAQRIFILTLARVVNPYKL